MRHAYLLGLVGRSHFSAQAQAEEARIEGDLIGIVGTPFSRHLQKGKQNHRGQDLRTMHSIRLSMYHIFICLSHGCFQLIFIWSKG